MTTGLFCTTVPTTFKLQVAGSVGPNTDNGGNLGNLTHRWGAVFATNGTIQTSDVRLKQQISDLGYGLSEVLRLRPVSFAWKNQTGGRRQLGLIAQEVEPLIPEVVVRDADPAAPLGMNYNSLVPVLINAVKEQQTQIEQQQLTIKQQQQQLESLRRVVCLDHPSADICK